MRFAIIDIGMVTNVAIADYPLGANWVAIDELSGIGVGWKLDVEGNFSAPEIILNQTQPSQIISKIEYMERFSNDELMAIYSLAKTNVQVEVWLEKFKIAESIDMSDSRIIDGLTGLSSLGILTPERVEQIKTGVLQ